MMNENQTFALSDIKILIIDAHTDTVELFAFILEGAGAKVTTADSVEEGLHQVRTIRPDILITEYYLTDGLGIELLIRIRSGTDQGCDNIPAVFVTGTTCLSEIAVWSETRALGLFAFLAKPVEPDELVATVIKLVGTNSA